MAARHRHSYALALGSNQRHARFGRPERILEAALERLDRKRIRLIARSPVVASRPVGPSRRTYANATAIIETGLAPPKLLEKLRKIENRFGRRRLGARWSARTLDLDIILWSGGIWASPGLTVPHIDFRGRAFVLAPLATIAGEWRDPITGLTIRHLKARLDRKRAAA